LVASNSNIVPELDVDDAEWLLIESIKAAELAGKFAKCGGFKPDFLKNLRLGLLQHMSKIIEASTNEERINEVQPRSQQAFLQQTHRLEPTQSNETSPMRRTALAQYMKNPAAVLSAPELPQVRPEWSEESQRHWPSHQSHPAGPLTWPRTWPVGPQLSEPSPVKLSEAQHRLLEAAARQQGMINSPMGLQPHHAAAEDSASGSMQNITMPQGSANIGYRQEWVQDFDDEDVYTDDPDIVHLSL